MPREDRRIFFDNTEVYKAVYSLCTQKQMKKPPPGHVVEIKETGSATDDIALTIMNPQDQSAETLPYSRDFMAAALMTMCRGLSIPLPKAARKSVIVVDGQIILRVQM